MCNQEELRQLESPETRSKEIQIRAEEAARMRREINRLEKEANGLRTRAREDEGLHEEMVAVLQGLYREVMEDKRGMASPNNNNDRRYKGLID
jgi:hypothetical protein